MKSKKILTLFLAFTLIVTSLTACTIPAVDPQTEGGTYKVGMVTDSGGVNDQSFNQSAWKGLTEFKEKYGDQVDVSYLESKQESDYQTNLDRMTDSNNELVWGIGFGMADAILNVAKINPKVHFALVDNSFGDDTPNNVTGIEFRAQESAFIVGYIAALTTKTNKVGFVGGMTSSIIDQFEYGYKAGVAYGAQELGKQITVETQYADTFSDASKGKAIANKLYTSGCDIVFHAAGGAGVGVIESAADNNMYAIGVDSDQQYLSPDHVLTSALKNVDQATMTVSERFMNGEDLGGQNLSFGLSEDAVGIPEDYSLMGKETYDKAMVVERKIASNEIIPPKNAEEFAQYNPTLGH